MKHNIFKKAKEQIKEAKKGYNNSFLGRRAAARHPLRAVISNILLSYALLLTSQAIFAIMNSGMYTGTTTAGDMWLLLNGNIKFATAAVCYTNALYILLLLFPLHWKEGRIMSLVTKLSFALPNAIAITANLCDCIYVRYTNRRTTYDVFTEFSNDDNIGKIIGIEIANNWWLVLLGVIIFWALDRFYTPANNRPQKIDIAGLLRYYTRNTLMLAATAALIVFGIRGGIGRTVRPITLSNANVYVSSPDDAAFVLNTPFTIIRTIGRVPFAKKNYYSEEELKEIYTPERQYTPADSAKSSNIVIMIVESFGKEYIGAYNPQRGEESFTPFLDSLITHSKSYCYSYSNGRKSIDGMPSVLSGIPMFVTPFISSSASLNNISSVAAELGKAGYSSAFFHGAPNGSMGFQAYAKNAGFQEYYGMTEYCQSPLHNGKEDFDGFWAIWDEPFLQFYAEEMNKMREPFATAVFTASSHHPFRIPQEYNDVFLGGSGEIHKCVQYTDHALQQFFNYACKQPWYNNTLFVITADHTNKCYDERYKTSSGIMEVPIIFFHPNGEAPFEPGIDSTMIAQQIDIMPTVLEYAGYEKPFIAFGKSLISTSAADSYAVNYNNETYSYYKGDYLLLYDSGNDRAISLYDIRKDVMMKDNILGSNGVENEMMRELRAIIQQYMARMTENRLTIESDTKNQQ